MTRVCERVDGINLSQGMPDFAPPESVTRAAQKAIQKGHNQYPVTFGESELRQAIAQKAASYNGLQADPGKEITVTCGATEAMIATLKALINPGDEIVVFEPFYENYGPDGILSGATPRYARLRAPEWGINREELKQAFTTDTKAIIINTPNNPTGKVFDREELDVIADLCQEYDSYAITDEIYEHILYDGADHISLATLDGMRERTITINSLSKTYSLTGWRVGWAIAPERITDRIRKVHDFLTVGAPTPLQHAGVTALNLSDSYYQALLDRYAKARRLLLDTLERLGFQQSQAEGSYYIMANVEDVLESIPDEPGAASHKLLDKTSVATVPGDSFFSGKDVGRNLVRFCFCKRPDTLERASRSLESALT
jgi:aminotransferase